MGPRWDNTDEGEHHNHQKDGTKHGRLRTEGGRQGGGGDEGTAVQRTLSERQGNGTPGHCRQHTGCVPWSL